MRLRPRRSRKRLPPAPFVNVEDRPLSRGEQFRDLVELHAIIALSLVLSCCALAVALILQATWWPVAGGVAAVVILFLILAFGA